MCTVMADCWCLLPGTDAAGMCTVMADCWCLLPGTDAAGVVQPAESAGDAQSGRQHADLGAGAAGPHVPAGGGDGES